MKVVGLVSGGKDSLSSLVKCVRYGHEIVCLANLAPEDKGDEELDSFCFQTVGHTHIDHIAAAMGLPLVKGAIKKDTSNVQTLEYPSLKIEDPTDEVERLYDLLKDVKSRFPEVTAVSSGAILSNYQRLRVESVCARLGLVSLSYLWQRDQDDYVAELVDGGFDVRLIKIASMGLSRKHLNQSLTDLRDYLLSLDYCHSAGEGGEYESFVADCPLYKTHRIEVANPTIIDISRDKFAPVARLEFTTDLVEKDEYEREEAAGLLETAPPAPPQHEFRSGAGREIDADVVRGCALLAQARAHPKQWTSPCGTWGFVAAAVCADSGEGKDIADAASRALHANPDLPATAFVNVYATDMGKFAAVNEGYNPNFDANPPSRAFVEAAGLPADVAMDMLTYHPGGGGDAGARSTLHVQSISEWAPACIGPYAQATTLGTTVLHAGMLGFDAPTMTLCGADADAAAAMTPDALREACVKLQAERALEANYPPIMACVKSEMRRVGMGVAYVTEASDVPVVAGVWATHFEGRLGMGAAPPLVVATVSALPRLAAVEIQLMSATTHAGVPGTVKIDIPVGTAFAATFENMAFAAAPSSAAAAAADALAAAGYRVAHARVYADAAALATTLALADDVPITVLPGNGAAVVVGGSAGAVQGTALLWAVKA